MVHDVRMAVPERLAWAVDTLDVRPGDRILEIGCGRGVAVSLICDKGGVVTALDRSATMIRHAKERNAAHQVRFLHGTLEDGVGGVYDKIFAVNVNLFWTRSPARELELIRGLLAPGGALYVFYEPPGPDKALGEKVAAALRAGDYTTTILQKGALVCVKGSASP